MPVYIFDEKARGHTSITTNPPGMTKRYVSNGLDSEFSVASFAYSAIPLTALVDGQVVYRDKISVESRGFRLYDVEATYTEKPNQQGQWTFNFDTTGATVQIMASKETPGKYGAGGNPFIPNYKGAIEYDGVNVNGTQIVIPALKLTAQYKHPQGIVTIAYAKFLASLTGTSNSKKFLGFDPGEILFLGATGSDGTNAEAEVSYMFAASSNVTGLNIGDISGIAKKGWEYLWIRFANSVDSGHHVAVPEFCYVERVYDETDLGAALGFGA